MPILGILASSIQASKSTAYESIATQTVGAGGVTSITFSSIPSTYKHLQLRCFVQETRATYGIAEMLLQFNGDSGANYSRHNVWGDGANAQANSQTSITSIWIGDGTLGTDTGGTFGCSIIDILDYANTNKNKTTRSLNGVDLNGTVAAFGGRVGLSSGLWMNTSAVNSIKLLPNGGSDFREYSSFALYGIKG